MRDRNETQLVTSAATGDAAAFTELVRRYRDMVYGYCYHRTCSFEDARDLAQETFVRAYSSLGQLRDASSFGPWLRRIAANLCNRWASNAREIPFEQIEVLQPSESPTTVLVRDALCRLPDNEQLAIVLHYVDGLSYSDIAGFLEISKGAVRGRLYRAREMLKAEVLKVTEEQFGANKLDEEFVFKAVNAAVRRAMNARDMLHDRVRSKKEVDKAVALVNSVRPDQVKDPVMLADALLSVGVREFVLGERQEAREHWDRAGLLMEQSGDLGGIGRWRSVIAYDSLLSGDLAGAHDLYLQAASCQTDGMSQEEISLPLADLAMARALESIGLGTDIKNIADLRAGCNWFEHQDSEIIHGLGVNNGFTSGSYPERLRNRPGPPIGPTPLPLVLMRYKPELGDTLRFVNGDGRAEESVMDTLSETVTTPAGTFEDCARSSSRIFASNTWEGEAVACRELWFAPGTGIVRMTYQAAGEPADTSDLTDFHIETPSADYIPLSVGNWWRWRWIDGEEQYRFRAQSYREVVIESGDQWATMHYVFAVNE